jgi:hypothetical protein
LLLNDDAMGIKKVILSGMPCTIKEKLQPTNIPPAVVTGASRPELFAKDEKYSTRTETKWMDGVPLHYAKDRTVLRIQDKYPRGITAYTVDTSWVNILIRPSLEVWKAS